VRVLRSRSERALVTTSRAIVIDLGAADQIDTRTLSELCAALRSIGRHGAELAVVSRDPRVRWALALCDIDGLELHPTVKIALARSRADQRKLLRLGRGARPWRRRPARRSTVRS
jgi:anti-anti-sigma regulatory factor